MFDAIFFDLDGTLIDTESVAIATGMAAFASLGSPVEAAFLHGLIGKDNPTSTRIIAQAMPGLDQTALRALWSDAFVAQTDKGLPLKPGAQQLLAALAGKGPVGLVTSTHRAEAHRKLAVAGIAQSFQTLVVYEDLSAPKPDPAPYLLAAERLGLRADRCLVFEDSEPGAESAFRAGCRVVQVPDILPASGRWAHHVAPTLLDGARMAGLVV